MSLLSRILGRAAATESPVDSVTYDDVGVTRHHANGRVEEVDWADLREVAVMVRGSSDLHIVLSGKNASTMVNPRVQGVELLAQRLGKLTGFDQEAFNKALAATERARFLCWQRGGTPPAAADAPAEAPAPAPAAAPLQAPVSATRSLDLELVPMAGEQTVAAPAPAARPSDSALRLDIAPTRTSVTDYAKDAMRDMARVYRVQMDGTIDSLVHIDRAIAELHASGATLESVNRSLYAMGSYAGAVMLRHVSGRWIDAARPGASRDGHTDPFLAIELPDGQRWSPIAICVDALLSGPDHSLLRTARTLLGTQRATSGST